MVASTRARGIRIVYDDRGRGERALLCLPGWCSDRSVYDPLVARSAPHRRVPAVDWGGHAQSESPSADFGPQELVDDALPVTAAASVDRVVPVATAHAGWVAIALRRALGERSPRLVRVEWIVLDPPRKLELVVDVARRVWG